MRLILLCFIICLNAPGMFAQLVKRCGTSEYMEKHFAKDPGWRERINAPVVESNPQNKVASSSAVVTIPVVFHIVYENTTENISSTRINDQLKVLNDDFRKLNADISKVPSIWASKVADTEIQFCLANVDPQGNPTSGVTRTLTTKKSFIDEGDSMKFSNLGGKSVWDRNKYLNIWVCDLRDGLLGYAQFPGGPSSTDGVVLNYKHVGTTGTTAPYNKGRTATHEIGHWLNLQHIWGDDNGACSDDDVIGDTPNQANNSFGCPTFPKTDACNPSSPGVMFMNYMDYTDDACMYMFTNDQKTRMQNALTINRPSLKLSTTCAGTPLKIKEGEFEKYFTIYPNPTKGQLNLKVEGLSIGDIDVTVFNVLGAMINSPIEKDESENTILIDISNQPKGIYFIQVKKGADTVVKRIVLQ